MNIELNEYEVEIIKELIEESLRMTGLGFAHFNLSEMDLAARVATMYVITHKLDTQLSKESQ